MDPYNRMEGVSDLSQLFPGITDTKPPTMAQNYADKNPGLMNQYGLSDIHSYEKMLRLKALMMMLRQKNPQMPENQLIMQATGVLKQMSNFGTQNKRQDAVMEQQRGMTY